MQSCLMVSGVECKTIVMEGIWNVIVGEKTQIIYREKVNHKGKKNGMSYCYKLKRVCQVCSKEFFSFLNAKGNYCSKKCSNSRRMGDLKRISFSDNEILKKRVQGFIRNEIDMGRIERSKSCSSCRSTRMIEAHHPDYNRSNEIMWLCRNCHMKLHFGHDTKGEPITI